MNTENSSPSRPTTAPPTVARALVETRAVGQTLHELIQLGSKLDPYACLAVLQARELLEHAVRALMRGARAEEKAKGLED